MHKYTKILLLSAGIVAFSNNASASGYQLNEYSATGLGRAFAGIGVVGDDYSAISFNPAGMILKGTGGQLGLSTVQMHSFVDGGIYRGENMISNRPYGKMNFYKFLPSGFAQYKINDRAVIGAGVYTPFGLASIYNKDWFGATHGVSTELDVIDTALGGAYKVTDQITLGAALIYRYVHGDIMNNLTNNPGSHNRFDLDGWEFAYNFGIMYEPVKDTRFGISYRLNSAHKVTGDRRIKNTMPGFDGTYPGVSKMTLPNQLLFSGYHKLNEKFGLSGAIRWTKWDIFDNFVMSSPSLNLNPTVVVPEKWKNTWTYSLGLDYYFTPEWTFRAGLSYDPTPIRDKFHRTVRIPDSTRYWTTLGASYKTKKWQFDLGYAHLFMTKGRTHETANSLAGPTTIKAEHDNYSNMVGVQFQYNF
ncbi:MAG: outer membrane protein transport protein [Alphaproteobacteria bacterium]|nr:outer membrane protein transport protein [Alphaproteobacteria bacterium]